MSITLDRPTVPEGGTGGTGPETALSNDEVFDILANRRRRFVVHLLLNEGELELGNVAERIAAWENGTTADAVNSTDRKYVYTALQQSHLPMMDEVGIIEYDKNRGTIETTDVIEEFDIYLEIVANRDIPWTEYYLGLGAVSCAIVVAVWANVFPFGLLADIAWAAFIATALTFSAAVHLYYAKQMRLGSAEEPPELAYDSVRE